MYEEKFRYEFSFKEFVATEFQHKRLQLSRDVCTESRGYHHKTELCATVHESRGRVRTRTQFFKFGHCCNIAELKRIRYYKFVDFCVLASTISIIGNAFWNVFSVCVWLCDRTANCPLLSWAWARVHVVIRACLSFVLSVLLTIGSLAHSWSGYGCIACDYHFIISRPYSISCASFDFPFHSERIENNKWVCVSVCPLASGNSKLKEKWLKHRQWRPQ